MSTKSISGRTPKRISKSIHKRPSNNLRKVRRERRERLRSMTVSLLRDGSIGTTHRRAEEIKRATEPLISLARRDSVARRRIAYRKLRIKQAVGMRFEEIGPKSKRVSGVFVSPSQALNQVLLQSLPAHLELELTDGAMEESRTTHEMRSNLIGIVDAVHGKSRHSRNLKDSLFMASEEFVVDLFEKYEALSAQSGELHSLLENLSESKSRTS